MAVRHPETNIIIVYLRGCAERGCNATYEEISRAIGHEIGDTRWRLNSAIDALQKEHNYIAVCIPNIGYKFTKDCGVAAIVSQEFDSRIKSQVRRSEDKLSTINWSNLGKEEMKEAISCSIRVQAHGQLVAPGFVQATKDLAAQSDKYLNAAKAAAELMKNIC